MSQQQPWLALRDYTLEQAGVTEISGLYSLCEPNSRAHHFRTDLTVVALTSSEGFRSGLSVGKRSW